MEKKSDLENDFDLGVDTRTEFQFGVKRTIYLDGRIEESIAHRIKIAGYIEDAFMYFFTSFGIQVFLFSVGAWVLMGIFAHVFRTQIDVKMKYIFGCIVICFSFLAGRYFQMLKMKSRIETLEGENNRLIKFSKN
jgi:hypothetical protein